MKALLLSAGLGERLRPITNSIPKCLVPINNTPLLEFWFRLFQKYKINDVLINTHYLNNKISNYIKKYNHLLNITLSYEESLLGSYGTLIHNINYIRNEKTILVFYSDNLTNLNINNFISFHNSHDLPITVGLFNCNNPSECGIVELDNENTIINFFEKPKNPQSNLANAGLYIFDNTIFPFFEKKSNKVLDISNDLLPKFINQMKGYLIKDQIFDIGTHKNYNEANIFISKNPKFID